MTIPALRSAPHPADNSDSSMRWFYFVRSRKRVGLWVRHYRNVTDADEAFYDGVRLFYPVPAILYDRGCPFYTYHAYLAKTVEEEDAPPPSEFRGELNL